MYLLRSVGEKRKLRFAYAHRQDRGRRQVSLLALPSLCRSLPSLTNKLRKNRDLSQDVFQRGGVSYTNDAQGRVFSNLLARSQIPVRFAEHPLALIHPVLSGRQALRANPLLKVFLSLVLH